MSTAISASSAKDVRGLFLGAVRLPCRGSTGFITAVDGRWWARANLRPERPLEESEQPSMLTRGLPARDVAVWTHERGLREVGLRDDADRKGPEACDILGGLLLLGLGDEEPEGGIQVPDGAVTFSGSPAL